MTNDWQIEAYSPDKETMWNEFVAASRNGTFLFDRRYMDYHADRFTDASLIALHRGKPMALLPADRTPDAAIRSHGGLTYGGWILPDRHIDGTDVVDLFEAWVEYERSRGSRCLIYKPVPYIYHRRPSQEDLYALFRIGATMEACGLSSAISAADRGNFNTLRRRILRKALTLSPEVAESDDIEVFMAMLTDCLEERHGVKPVHTAAEVRLLKERFPEEIRLFTAHIDGRLQAGVLMYVTPMVAHAQYIATTPEGRDNGALTVLFNHLINSEFADKPYFDFGISTEQGGTILNSGLLRQKASMGGSGVVYSTWKIDLS